MTSVCWKNSNTGFRGFGAPQAVFIVESVLDHLATAARLPSDVLRRSNLYRDGDVKHTGTAVEDFNVSVLHVPHVLHVLHVPHVPHVLSLAHKQNKLTFLLSLSLSLLLIILLFV